MSPKDPSAELVWVLAVDDQRPFRDAAHRVVDATAGFAWAGEAGSAEEAVNLMREREPDIVIMDVRMPDMDGIEAARLVAAERPDVTVLLVSAEPLASPAADLLRSRAAAFSRKQNFGPALLRLLTRDQDASAARRHPALNGGPALRRRHELQAPADGPEPVLHVGQAAAARRAGSKPQPSSRTSKARPSGSCRSTIRAVVPCPPCLAAFWSASAQVKYTAASTPAA